MWARVVSAAVGAPLLLAAVYFGGWPLFAALAALVAGSAYELGHLWPRALGQSRLTPLWYVVAALLPLTGGRLAMTWSPADTVYGVTAGTLIALLLAAVMLLGEGGQDPRNALVTAAGIAAAAVYIGLPFTHMQLFYGLSGGAVWVTWVLLVVWTSDIAAFYIGSLLGGRKLAPRISPGKTISGAVAGVLFAALFGWAFARLLGLMFIASSHFAPLPAAVATVLAIVGIAGDLTESVLKRAAQVKDAGVLIPGHGGLLDRFDSLLFVLPVAYWLVWLYHA